MGETGRGRERGRGWELSQNEALRYKKPSWMGSELQREGGSWDRRRPALCGDRHDRCHPRVRAMGVRAARNVERVESTEGRNVLGENMKDDLAWFLKRKRGVFLFFFQVSISQVGAYTNDKNWRRQIETHRLRSPRCRPCLFSSQHRSKLRTLRCRWRATGN
jgi:hypothetical protein